jgi:alanyl-tRNA synthetase
MNAEESGKIIEESSVEQDGKKVLPCAKAFRLSGRHGIPLKDIGAYCTRNGIKIIGCQLGCFK